MVKRPGSTEHAQWRILDILTGASMTADECASIMERSILYVRPRFSELVELKAIKKTGIRRKNASGLDAHVWAIA